MKTVNLEGVWIDYSDDPFAPMGDSKAGPEQSPGTLYVAFGNTGVKLLTVLKDDVENGWVVPREMAYPFNRYQCFKVLAFDGDSV